MRRDRAEEAQPADKGEKQLKPGQCRGYMRKELAAAYPEIVKGFVEGAKAGSCAHVKLATELLALPEKKQRRTKGSATRILEKLMNNEG